MKKAINYFSRVLVTLVLSAGLVVTGCYDDSALQTQLKDLDSRVEELERLTSQQNTNLESLQTIVNALQERDYVTSVAPIKEGDEIVGYTITFSKSGAVTIYNGEDGYVPAMGVKQDETDNQWYWTVDGEWMADSEGNKVRASAKDGEDGDKGETGVTPQLKIMDGYWYVSYDGGKTWEEETLGQATGDKGYTMFAEVSYDDNYLYITMSDGQKLTLPRVSSNQGEGGEGEGDVEQVGPIKFKISEITASTVTFTGHLNVAASDLSFSQVTIYYSDSEPFNVNTAQKVSTTTFDEQQNFTITLQGLKYGTKYNYSLVDEVKSEKDYSDVAAFTTAGVVPSVSVDESSVTATSASFSGTVTGLSEIDKSSIQVGVAYSSESDDLKSSESTKVAYGEISEDGTYSMSIDEFRFNKKYYYCTYVKQNGIYKYGEVKELTTVNVVPSVSVDESSVTATTASFSGTVTGLSEIDKSSIQVGVAYSSVTGDFQSNDNIKVASGEISEDGTYSMSMKQYTYDAIKYYYCSYILQNGVYTYGEVKEFSTKGAVADLNMSSATDLSSSESANCYIISQSGTYKFKTVKGNSSTSVGNVASCTILWESFGTSTTPELLNLISGVCYKDNYIAFETSSTFTEGNAVIAAKDASGKILWSWHIWLTDKPTNQTHNEYTMMDRNIGATSTTPGEQCSQGLLYQWGRKDPFWGNAESTIKINYIVSDESPLIGTIEYSINNPTTYMTAGHDWLYYEDENGHDNTRWGTLKTIYDPCPAGWQVPKSGVFIGNTFSAFDDIYKGVYISDNRNFWYPGLCHYDRIHGVFSGGGYWTCSSGSWVGYFSVQKNDVGWDGSGRFSYGYSVRCMKE